jgi:hypothetical protein
MTTNISWTHEPLEGEPYKREGKTSFGDRWVAVVQDPIFTVFASVVHNLDTNEYLWSVNGKVGYTPTLEQAKSKIERLVYLYQEIERVSKE